MSPVILLHGYPLDHTLWRFVVPLLEKQTQVFTPNLPGFGDNPTLPLEASMDHIADHLLGIYELHDLQSATMVGMSMGGYVALAFAERHPERVAALGLVNSQAAADPEEAKGNRYKMIEKIRSQGPSVAGEALALKMFAPANAEKLKGEVYAGVSKAKMEGLTWALEAMAKRPDRTAVLKNLKVPKAIIHGTEDQIIPLEKAKSLSELAAAKFVPIEGAGHGSPLENPEAVAQAILDLSKAAGKPKTGLEKPRKSNRPPITISPTEHGL